MVANVFKMSIFQLYVILIFQLCICVYGLANISFPRPKGLFGSKKLNASQNLGRIVGGSTTSIEKYPFMISLQWRATSGHRCGGTYIVESYILTAAHCVTRDIGNHWHVENAFFMVVVAGSSTLRGQATWQIRSIQKFMVHSDYNSNLLIHDIALIRISEPFRITQYVNFIPLSTEVDPELVEKNVNCTIVGWGLTAAALNPPPSGTMLHCAEIPLIPLKECTLFPGYFTVTNDQLCAGFAEGKVDSCQGDSGGPLIHEGFQIAIISWGFGCAAPNSPGVYTRVDTHVKWINETIAKNATSLMLSSYLFIITSLLATWITQN